MKFMKAKASIFGLNFHIMRRLLNGCLLRPQMNIPYPRALQMAKLMMARKHTFTNATSIILWPFKQLNVSPSVMFYNNNYSTSYRNNVFLNCNIEYTLGNTILSLQCSNLLNNNVFRRYNDNGIIRYSSEYHLRGRTIMVGIRIRIT